MKQITILPNSGSRKKRSPAIPTETPMEIQIWPIDRSQNEFSHVAIFSMRGYVVVTTPKLAQDS